jgi:hypothetical protein
MVLEETLIIRGPIDVPEVTRAFREAGMPARITQTVALEGLVSAKGTIRDLKALLKEGVSRIEEGEDTGPGGVHDPFLDVVERIAEVLAEFMERYQPGDVIPMADIKEWMAPSAGAAPEEEPAEAVLPDVESSMLYRFMAITALDENGLIETGAEGAVVQGHMEPEDVVLTLPGGVVEDIEPEVLKEHGILTEMTVTAVPEYRLEFGPEAVLGADLDKVDELADDLEIDEDEYISFREGVSLKQVVTARTIEVLDERGTLAPAEVAEALGSSAVGGTEDGWEIVLDLTPEFVKGLLTDLRKIGLVRKKGAGFRSI